MGKIGDSTSFQALIDVIKDNTIAPSKIGAINGVASLNSSGKIPDIQIPLSLIHVSQIGIAGGVAELDSNGKVPSAQLPSYVDEVLEYASLSAFPAEGETGKIYIALDTNKTYRWGGSAYVEISESLALGETSSTAFPGNRGKAIEDKIPSNASASNKFLTEDAIPKVSIGFESKTWSGFTYLDGARIWTDGTYMYYSDGGNNYVLDKATSTWSIKTWYGLTDFDGYSVWTDGTDIYYSYNSNQYILDKDSSTWSAKTWNGLTSFYGYAIWTDGDNIYYSYNGNNYVLDKATSTWTQKTWSGLTNFDGSNIWTDGTDIYYSYGANQYVLNKATSTWSIKTWYGLTNFNGSSVWTDGTDIYYSYGANQYVLNKSTSTWSTKTWNGLTNFYGYDIWTDGTDIYHSFSSNQYVLIKKPMTELVGKPSGIASLDGNGKVPSSQLPTNEPNGIAPLDGEAKLPFVNMPDFALKRYTISCTPSDDPLVAIQNAYASLSTADKVKILNGQGNVIRVPRATSGFFDYFIGGTDPDYIRVMLLSFYSLPRTYVYDGVGWRSDAAGGQITLNGAVVNTGVGYWQRRGNVVQIYFFDTTFKAAGDTQTLVTAGQIPPCITQVSAFFGGADGASCRAMQGGDTFWISGGSDVIQCHVNSQTYSLNHYGGCVYLTDSAYSYV